MTSRIGRLFSSILKRPAKVEIKTKAVRPFQIELFQGDITTLKVDAIVNAAKASLLGGSGVDGAIHTASGPELLEECRGLGGCKTGEAKITKGYNLPAKHVIHTVGPIYGRENGNEEQLLADCYWNSLVLAKENGLKSIAFPGISTGVYHFPKEAAAKIALATVKKFLSENAFDKVIFVQFSQEDHGIYEALGG
ncbi:MAG: O-acetyl-ADP-ribose deacetylase [Candidatus Saganbacteria bacterium]|nr:O-acetyl-ADP-ribose deacetylase [Candidatus Saganbacteria bacterium]